MTNEAVVKRKGGMGKARRKCAEHEGQALENEELENLKEALPRLKVQTGVGRDGFHPKVPLELTKRNKRRSGGFFGESGAEWQMAAASMHDDVLLDSEECHEREADCAYAEVDTLVGSLESAGGGEVAAELPR